MALCNDLKSSVSTELASALTQAETTLFKGDLSQTNAEIEVISVLIARPYGFLLPQSQLKAAELITKFLSQNPISVLPKLLESRIFVKIFNPRQSFYDRNSSVSPQIAAELASIRQKMGLAQRDTTETFSVFFRHFILVFEARLSEIVTHLRECLEQRNCISFSAMNDLLEVIATCTKHAPEIGLISENFAQTCLYFAKLDLRLANTFQKTSQKDLTSFVDCLETMLCLLFDRSEFARAPEAKLLKAQKVFQVSEMVHLHLALNLLQMPVLEKKVIGSTLLVMKVVGLKNSDKYFDETRLAAWCKQVGIFDVFFGSSFHPEVIKKTYYFLDFLYKNQGLTQKELKQMWNVTTKHEAFRAAIFKALTYLSSKLKTDELNFLFQKVNQMHLKDHDKFSLGLLKSISKRLAPVSAPQPIVLQPINFQITRKTQDDTALTSKRHGIAPQSMKKQHSLSPKDFGRKNKGLFFDLDNPFETKLSGRTNSGMSSDRDRNPLEVPEEKQDKLTADEEVLPVSGQGSTGFLDFQNPEPRSPKDEVKIEESVHTNAEMKLGNCLYTDRSLGLTENSETQILAKQVLEFMWMLCQDESVTGSGNPTPSSLLDVIQHQSKKGLSHTNQKLCIEQFTEVVTYNFPQSLCFFIRLCLLQIQVNRNTVTMQTILTKLILGASFPLVSSKKSDLPKNRSEFVQVLEKELGLTSSCLSAYIDFKREVLQLINQQQGNLFFGGHLQEDDCLETQSSLDGGQADELEVAAEDRTLLSESDTNAFAVPSSQSPSQYSPSKQVRQNRTLSSVSNLPAVQTVRSGQIEETKERTISQSSLIRPTQANRVSPPESRSFMDTLVTNKVYNLTFEQEMNERLGFLKMIISQSPEKLLKENQIQFLWECLVNNAFYLKERDSFFRWCYEILKASQRKTQGSASEEIFSSDCIETIYFETLLQLDFKYFTEVIFECFQAYFLHVNERYGQIVNSYANFEVYDCKLIGIDALWEIVLQAENEVVYTKASEFLQKLYRKLQFEENGNLTLNDVKLEVLNNCMNQIEAGKALMSVQLASEPDQNKIDDCANRISRAIRILCDLIEAFEGQKSPYSQRKQRESKDVQVVVTNQVSQTQGPSRILLKLPFNTTTIHQVLESCASSIHPKKSAGDLELIYKGKPLSEGLKTLKEVVGNCADEIKFFLSSKTQFELDYELGFTKSQKLGSTNQDEEQIKLAVEQLKDFLGGSDVSDEVIALALKKCNLDVESAIGMIVEPERVADLAIELEQMAEQEAAIPLLKINHQDVNMENPSAQTEVVLNQMISNHDAFFDMFFELLNFGNAEVSSAVWNLLMQIPVNSRLLDQIKSMDLVKIDSEFKEFEGWSHLIDPSSTYKMLYSLQLVNTLLHSPIGDQKASLLDWRQHFVQLGGFNHLFDVLVTTDVDDAIGEQFVNKSKEKPRKGKSKRLKTDLRRDQTNKQRNDKAKCLGLLISVIKIYVQASLLSMDTDNSLYKLIVDSNTNPYKKASASVKEVDKEQMDQIFLRGLGKDKLKESLGTLSNSSKSGPGTPCFQASSGTATPPSQQPAPKAAKQNQVEDFPKLIDQLKNSGLSEQLINRVIDFPALIHKLLEILNSTVVYWSGNDSSQEFPDLVQHACDLLLPCLVWKPDLLVRDILNFQGLESLLVNSLLRNKNDVIRKALEKTFKLICSQPVAADEVQPKLLVMKLLFKNLPTDMPDNCEEFFNLLAFTLRSNICNFRITNSQPVFQVKIDFKAFETSQNTFSADYLLNVLVNLLKNRKSAEDGAVVDKVQAGCIKIIEVLLDAFSSHKNTACTFCENQKPQSDLKLLAESKHDLVTTIFGFLFDLPGNESLSHRFNKEKKSLPHCKSQQSRKRAFKLLLTMSKNQKNILRQLTSRIIDFHETVKAAIAVTPTEQLEEFSAETIASNQTNFAGLKTKFVGLKNFGSTCYMNSLIQQLFMIPAFRAGILRANLAKTDCKVLKELQVIFANLQESRKQFFKPQGFINAFKFYGEPVDVRTQQDTHEFFNVLCDYIEKCSEETKAILKNSIGGVIANQTKSLEPEYPYIGEKEEDFFAIPLDIKNKKSLQEALDLYVKPDILEGDNKYQCEQFGNQLIDAQRRTYLKELSNTVVFNLKRFEFDLHTMQRLKINDYCEFPEVIDLRPWTKEGILEKERRARKQDWEENYLEGSQQELNDPSLDEIDDAESEPLESGNNIASCGRFSENDAIDSEEDLTVTKNNLFSQFQDSKESENYDMKSQNSEKETEDQSNFQKSHFEDLIGLNSHTPSNACKVRAGSLTSLLVQRPASAAVNAQTKPVNLVDQRLRSKKLREKQKQKYLYRLVGVLVHSGSANSGHYYSYIRQRDGTDGWFEFNDTRVTDFDLARLEETCFGSHEKEAPRSSSPFTFQSSANAYLLFYEKDAPSEAIQISTAIADNQESELSKLVNNMDTDLFEAIQKQNEAFVRLKLFYDVEYLSFVKDFACLFQQLQTERTKAKLSPSLSASEKTAQLVKLSQTAEKNPLEYLVAYTKIMAAQKANVPTSDSDVQILKFSLEMSEEVLLRAKDVNSFTHWMQIIQSLLTKNPLSCLWVVKHINQSDLIRKLLLENTNLEVRDSFSKMIRTAISITAQNEEDYLYSKDTYFIPTQSGQLEKVSTPQSSAARLISFLFNAVFTTSVRTNWQRYDEYFEVIKDFTQLSFITTKYMIEEEKGIYKLLEFILNNKPPFSATLPRMGDSSLVEPNVAMPLDILSFLIKSTLTNGVSSQQQYAPTSVFEREDRHITIPVDQVTYLLTKECTLELLRKTSEAFSAEAITALTAIVSHLSWGDRFVSQFFIQQLTDFLCTQLRETQFSASHHLETAFAVLFHLLKLHDGDLQTLRFSCFFDFQRQFQNSTPFFNFLKTSARSNHSIALALKHISQLALQEQPLKEHLISNIDAMDWVLTWLQDQRQQQLNTGGKDSSFEKDLQLASLAFREIFGLGGDFQLEIPDVEMTDIPADIEKFLLEQNKDFQIGKGTNTSFKGSDNFLDDSLEANFSGGSMDDKDFFI